MMSTDELRYRDSSGPDRSPGTPGMGEVLIRSTRARVLGRRPGPGPGPGPVHITVHKMPDPHRVQSHRQKPGGNASSREAMIAESGPPLSGGDMVTSRFVGGSRGIALEALRQRSLSALHKTEVKVPSLQPPAVSIQDAGRAARVRVETGQASASREDVTNTAAAATAAAVAAAAPIIKVQSQMEAQVSQLMEDVQKLKQNNRKSHVTEQSLGPGPRKNHQELSQPLESALHIRTSHAPTTSDPSATRRPPRLQVTHPDATAERPQGSLATAASSAMETWHHNQRQDQTRDDWRLRVPQRESTHSLISHSQEAASTANPVLRELRQLRAEMKTLLKKPEDFPITSRFAWDPPQSQPKQSQQNLVQFQQNQDQPNLLQSYHVQQSQIHPDQVHPSHLQSDQIQQNWVQSDQFPQNQVHPNQLQTNQVQQSQIHPDQVQQNQAHPKQIQPDQSRPSQSQQFRSHWDREFQRRPVTPSPLEEAAEVLRDCRRRKKLLDENLMWVQRQIGDKELRDLLDTVRTDGDWEQQILISKIADAWMNLPDPKSKRETRTEKELEAEAFLTQRYGQPPYSRQSGTQKKKANIGFSSPALPLCRKSRPRQLESVRVVKMKSCETQTSLTPPSAVAPPPSWNPPTTSSPAPPQICSPTHLSTGAPADGPHPTAVVILLGPPRICHSSMRWRPPADVAPSTDPSAANVAAENDTAPELTVNLPEELSCQQRDTDEAPPPPLTPCIVNIMEGNGEEHEESEEMVFPGTDFLSVADIVQEEEQSVVGEDAVELDGGPSPPAVQYQGPVFPPQAPAALQARDQGPILGLDAQRGGLEDRLVEWVEQQVMSRVISEMIQPPLDDPTQSGHSGQSDAEEQSVTSDIAEAAGGSDLQRFLDANPSVDSELIKKLVTEVLIEIATSMLDQRQEPSPSPGPGPDQEGPGAQEQFQDNVLSTPAPTPPPHLALPSSREATPIATPLPSEPNTPPNEEAAQPTTPERVATPTPSPEPAPSARCQSPYQALPTSNWGDVELPLDEGKPEDNLNTHQQTLLMSVAEEECPLSSPLSPCLPPAPSPAPPPEPGPALPSISSEESSSSCSSSSSSSFSTAVTSGTDAALKHISEGELLISLNQQAAMTAEEAAACSFSSSLREFQDMDFDPPSEGQVEGHDLCLRRLTKSRGERPRPEGLWGREEPEDVSLGEVSDNGTVKPGGAWSQFLVCSSASHAAASDSSDDVF